MPAWSEAIGIVSPVGLMVFLLGAFSKPSLCRRQPLLREAIRRRVSRYVLRVRDFENLQYGIVDVVCFVQRTLRVPPRDLAVHVDDAPGVGDVVRRVKNSEPL